MHSFCYSPSPFCCALGMPVAFAVGLRAVAGALWIELPLEALMIQITSGVNKFTLLAILFFIPRRGAIGGGRRHRLTAVNFAYVFVGFIRGGLSLVNIVASTFFGAISGSSVADTASIGSVMIPEMERRVSPRVCGGGHRQRSVQAILIPPSHNSRIYSLAAGGTVSIATLFIAGVLPGLLLGLCLMTLCLCFAHKRAIQKAKRSPFKQALKILLDALWG